MRGEGKGGERQELGGAREGEGMKASRNPVFVSRERRRERKG